MCKAVVATAAGFMLAFAPCLLLAGCPGNRPALNQANANSYGTESASIPNTDTAPESALATGTGTGPDPAAQTPSALALTRGCSRPWNLPKIWIMCMP